MTTPPYDPDAFYEKGSANYWRKLAETRQAIINKQAAKIAAMKRTATKEKP